MILSAVKKAPITIPAGLMALSNVFMLLIGMLCKMAKIFFALLFLFTVTSCRMPESFGFYQPITMNLTVPDGPAEYKAGWHSGCTSALSLKVFANSFVYNKGKGPDFGSGVYQHDPAYQTGWGQGWFACALHVGDFVNFHAMQNGPLQ